MDRPVVNRTRAAARAVVPAVAIVVALGLSGCGSSSGGSPSSPTASPSPPSSAGQQGGAAAGKSGSKDPCVLVSAQEAQRLAGTSLDKPVALDERCTYTAPPSGPSAQVEVFVGETAKDYLAAERGIGHDLQPLAGVGDEAYIEDYAVFVNKHDFWVSIDLTNGNTPAQNRAPLEDLARTVAGRM